MRFELVHLMRPAIRQSSFGICLFIVTHETLQLKFLRVLRLAIRWIGYPCVAVRHRSLLITQLDWVLAIASSSIVGVKME